MIHQLKENLAELEKIALVGDADKRPEALEVVTNLFFATYDAHGLNELEFFGMALERIAFNLSPEERSKLASRLADVQHAPKLLVRRLASDEIAVARPILKQSPCLSEEDLVELAGLLDQEHLHAISQRETLTCKLTEVIVDRGNNDVLDCVTRNEGARFSDNSLEKLGESAGKNRKLFSALSKRRDVPDEIIAEARGSIAELNAKQLKQIARNRRPRSMVITEAMVAGFARGNMLAETIRSMSLMTGHPEIFVKQCFLQGSFSALAQLCKANGFETVTYATLLKLRSKVGDLQGQTVADALRKYRYLTRSDAQRALGYEAGEEAMVASRT